MVSNDQTKSVLLIEDNPDDIDLTLHAFKKNGIANPVIVARDGVEALDYLFGTGSYAGRDVMDRPALVLLDLKLPRIDGLEVLRRIRADRKTRSLIVVVLTSSNADLDVKAAYDLGANAYLRKPVEFKLCVEMIRTLGLFWLVFNQPPTG